MNPIPDRSLEEPEERGETAVCDNCERRLAVEDLTGDGLCEGCRDLIHFSIELERVQTIENGPERAACPCPHCGAKFRPRPIKELITTPSIMDLREIARRDSK